MGILELQNNLNELIKNEGDNINVYMFLNDILDLVFYNFEKSN